MGKLNCIFQHYRWMKTLFKIVIIIISLLLILFVFYFNNTRLTNPVVANYYTELKKSLKQNGYSSKLIVISTKRYNWENKLFEKFSVAAKISRHLKGEAIDFLVLYVNSDGKINKTVVDVVYNILDKKIIKDKGGIGKYINQNLLIRQIIHIDCRGVEARWNY